MAGNAVFHVTKNMRKAFNFYRSYYDVFKELEKPADKISFIEALLEKQFNGIDPTHLKGMSKFAYISQKHNIEAQVKGYTDKTGHSFNDTPTQGGAAGGTVDPSIQEKEEGKEKEEEKGKGKTEKVFSSTVSDCYYKIKDFFPLDVIPKDQKSLDKWMDCIRLLTEADGFTTEQIEFVVKKYTQDDFWSGNFQSLLKLRKKNKDGIQYMVYFKNQILKEKDNGNSKGDQLREVMELLGH